MPCPRPALTKVAKVTIFTYHNRIERYSTRRGGRYAGVEGTPDCASATTHRRSLRTKRPQQPRSSCASTSHYNGLKIASLLLRVHSGYPPGMVPDMHRRGIYIAPRWGCCFNRGRDLLRSTELDCPSAAAGRRASPQLAVRPNCALWGSAPASGSLGRRGVPAPGEDNRCAVFIMVRTLGNSHYTLRARRFVKPPCHVTCYCVAVDLYVSTSPPPTPDSALASGGIQRETAGGRAAAARSPRAPQFGSRCRVGPRPRLPSRSSAT